MVHLQMFRSVTIGEGEERKKLSKIKCVEIGCTAKLNYLVKGKVFYVFFVVVIATGLMRKKKE